MIIFNDGSESSEALIRKVMESQRKYWDYLKQRTIQFNRKEFYEWLERRGESHHLQELIILKETPEILYINLAVLKEWLKLLGNGGDFCIYDIKTPLDKVTPEEFMQANCYESVEAFEIGIIYSACYRNFLKEIQGKIME